ncbi:MAG: GNAT family N-acetyltransferase [Candidatus Omnitrophica bacterium]|nr:GNAT family N-acetyltransferase [Candidatus Omnitrophota bacterium]MBU1997766.1 GNAT family N-acetyltransferase [Candidatus Omnitrophota bacterium]MBU4333345.1 GNAT family N-acetyltransferase [Candidatus Omnitrophota bacterium]
MNTVLFKNFDKIKKESWDKLVYSSSHNTIFQTLEWNRAWWESYSSSNELFIIFIVSNEELEAIAPLYIHIYNKKRVLKFIGTGRSDYLDFIYIQDKPESLFALLKFIDIKKHMWDETAFDNILSESRTNGLLKDYSKITNLKLSLYSSKPCPILEIDDDKNILHQITNKKHLVTLEKQIEKKGKLEIIHLYDKDRILDYLNIFFEQHINRQSTANISSLFLDENTRNFYKRFLVSLSENKNIIFTVINCNKTPIAFHLGFVFNKTFYFYKPSFNISWFRFSPGQLLLKKLFEYIIQSDINVLDFGSGEDQYKNRFSNKEQTINSYKIHKTFISAQFFNLASSLNKNKLAQKIIDQFKNIGPTKTLTNVFKRIFSCIFNIKEIFLYKVKDRSKIEYTPRSVRETITIREVGISDLFNLDHFESNEKRNSYIHKSFQRYKDDQRCLGAFKHDKLSAIAWIKTNNSITISETDTIINNIAYCHTVNNCLTVPKYRNMGLYKLLLEEITKTYESNEIYIYCETKNIASIKGIEQFFNLLYRLYRLRIFGISFKIKLNA